MFAVAYTRTESEDEDELQQRTHQQIARTIHIGIYYAIYSKDSVVRMGSLKWTTSFQAKNSNENDKSDRLQWHPKKKNEDAADFDTHNPYIKRVAYKYSTSIGKCGPTEECRQIAPPVSGNNTHSLLYLYKTQTTLKCNQLHNLQHLLLHGLWMWIKTVFPNYKYRNTKKK